MTWLAILRALLSVALTVADIVREKRLMDAGDARATARSLAAMAQRLEIGDRVAAEIDAMTPDDLDAYLRGDK